MTGMEPAVAAAFVSAASTGLTVAQSQKQAKAQSQAMANQARAKLEQIEKQRKISHRQTRQKLRKDLASKRALFGASGLTGSRSADAILANLQRETERRLADQDWFIDREAAGLRGTSSTATRPSLLDFGQAVLSGMSGISNQMAPSTPKPSLLGFRPRGNPHP